MSDLTLVFDGTRADFDILANDLAQSDDLESSILMSLFLDARTDDTIPAGLGSDPRGYWADALSTNDNTGSKLWLLGRSKATPDILGQAQQYCEEALQWLLDDKVATAVVVSATRVDLQGRDSELLIAIQITKPDQSITTYQYNFNWTAQAARQA